MDSIVISVGKKRDFALETDKYVVQFELSFGHELSEEIILNTSYVETVGQMVKSVADDLFEIAVTLRTTDPEHVGEVDATPIPPSREAIMAALGPMKRCQQRTFDEPCTICTAGFTPTQFYRELRCGHCFHKKCIDKWLLECEPHCPNCRTLVVSETLDKSSTPCSPPPSSS